MTLFKNNQGNIHNLRFFGSIDDDDNNNGNGNGDNGGSNKSGSFPALIPSKIPSKVGYGDEAPRMPHVLALPVTNRPLFPGVVTSVTLTEPATIDALEQLQRENDGNNVYISAFLRKKNPTGVS